MKLSKTATQAALAMAYLAQRPDGQPTQARQIAEHLGIPTDSALKVLQALARQRLLKSQLGRHGGYFLKQPATQVSLRQIVEAIDGPIESSVPSVSESRGAQRDVVQRLERFCDHSAGWLREQLDQFSVADLIQSVRASVCPITAPLAA